MTIAVARWRLALGLAQRLAAAAVPVLWLRGASPVILAVGILSSRAR
jgi:hypothetical protein